MRAALKAEIRSTLWLALPIVATQVSMNLMGFVDTLMVGQLGATELGAVAIGRSMYFTLGLVLVGTIAGTEPIISQAFGAGDRKRGAHTLWQGLWIALLLGLPLWALLSDMRWMFRLTQQTEPVVEAAHVYLGARAWGTIPFLMFAASRSFLNAIGRPRAVLAVALFANVVNAVLNYGLIFGNLGMPALGLRGAGIASSLSTLAMAAYVLRMVSMQRGDGFALGFRWPDFTAIRQVLTIGAPIGLQIGAEVGVFGAAALLVGNLGEVPLAAHQIALSLASFTFMVPLGIGVASSVRVGQLIGQGATAAADLAGKVAISISGLFMGFSSVLFMAVPTIFVGLFTKDPAVTVLGAALLRIAGIFQVSDGLQACASGCLRGAADTKVPMLANLVGHWLLGLPLGYAMAFPLGFGARGIWFGLTTSLTVVAAALLWRFLSGGWKQRAPLAQATPQGAAA